MIARLLATVFTEPRRRLAQAAGRIRRALRYEAHAFWRSRPINPHAVLYEAFNGSGLLCKPEALFRQLRITPDQAHLRHN
ncbi:hypothetical protein [Cryobacterium sp. N21]|uniref:hypothetical protein n=1 Tax=Cryobacterium sp. N21 TaxID=2048289 RepID=UPI000CE4AB9E|nr:hypothetical protein [Cryobacterium sp. N21]